MRQFINIVESVSPTVLYHQAPANMRERIAQLGLQHPYDIPSDLGVEMSNDETSGIYFTDNRGDIDKRFDMWEVDVSGLKLHPDDTTDWPEGHVWWVTYDEVGPERLRLIYQGSGISVRESFSSAPENIRSTFENNTEFYSFKVDGREIVVGFNGDFDEEGGDFYLSFTIEDSRGKQTAKLTKSDAPMRILGSVANIIERFIEEHQPDQIDFSVDNDEQRRITTYDRILDHLEKNQRLPHGYVWDRDGSGNYFIFRDGHR